MSQARKYMAASVPRFLRQTKLGYLPLNCVIGSRLVKGDGGANLFFDIVMLPIQEFQRMRTNVGLQHVIAPALKAGPTFSPGFVLADVREIIVPAEEPAPEAFARNHFMVLFKLTEPEVPSTGAQQSDTKLPTPASDFSQNAQECTRQPIDLKD